MKNEKNQIAVWDGFIRIFHWSFALLFFLAYATGDENNFFHKYTGYLIVVLVAARIFWGVGTKYALFKNFTCSPREALAYIHGLFSGKSKHYLGHNPAASYMIFLLLISSLVVCLSGYKAYTAKEGKLSIELSRSLSLVASAYADDDDDEREKHNDRHAARERNERAGREEEGDSYWEDIHEVSAQFMMTLVILHVIGVAVSSKVHNENLIKSMITGKKEVDSK